MRKIREILRQKWALGRTHRVVAQSLSVGLGTVSGVERRARAAGLSWTDVEGLADGYRYTQFCEIYRRWLTRRGLSMRQIHRAGEKCFVDYAGQKPRLIEPATCPG